MESEGIMSETNRSGGMGIMLAAVVGAAVGAGVALLVAPCSGKETRGWLAQRTRRLQETTTSAYAQGKNAIQQAAKEIGSDGETATTPLARSMYGKPVAPPTRS
jgi:gas vesicle protein